MHVAAPRFSDGNEGRHTGTMEHTESALLDALAKAVISCNREEIISAAKGALEAEIDPIIAIEGGLMPGLEKLEDEFELHKVAIPRLVAAEYAVRDARKLLLSCVSERLPRHTGKVVLGIARGDIHEIGKNISKAMLAARGLECHDLGVDVPADQFLKKADEVGAGAIAVGTLMSGSMDVQKEIVDELNRRGRREKYAVIIGGRSEIVTPAFAEEIGADACGSNISDFVQKIRELGDLKHKEHGIQDG